MKQPGEISCVSFEEDGAEVERLWSSGTLGHSAPSGMAQHTCSGICPISIFFDDVVLNHKIAVLLMLEIY